MSPERGKFLTFEGCDGCGKSTQIQLAVKWLKKKGYDILQTREPGGTEIGERIRELLLDPANVKMTDMTEMLLYAAARAQLAREILEPALNGGKLVVCDRWVDSSVVYQGSARGLGEMVGIVNSFASGALFSPDITILLDLDTETALRRAGGTGGGDRIESLGACYQEKVRKAYLELAALNKDRIHVVDASGTAKEVHKRVCAVLSEALT